MKSKYVIVWGFFIDILTKVSRICRLNIMYNVDGIHTCSDVKISEIIAVVKNLLSNTARRKSKFFTISNGFLTT